MSDKKGAPEDGAAADGPPKHPTRRRSQLGLATQDLVARYWGAVIAALPVAGLVGSLLTKAFDRGVSEGTRDTIVQRHTEQIATLDREYAAETAVRAEADKQIQASIAELKVSSSAIATEIKFLGDDVRAIKQAVVPQKIGAQH